MLRYRRGDFAPDCWLGRYLSSSIAASTRSRVSVLTAALSLSTADTVALETPVWRATSIMVGRFPVIAYWVQVRQENRTDLNLFDTVQAAEDRVWPMCCQARPGLCLTIPDSDSKVDGT